MVLSFGCRNPAAHSLASSLVPGSGTEHANCVILLLTYNLYCLKQYLSFVARTRMDPLSPCQFSDGHILMRINYYYATLSLSNTTSGFLQGRADTIQGLFQDISRTK